MIPLLKSGYYGDDAINSYTKGIINFEKESLFSFTRYYMFSWIETGRFFPLAWYLYTLFYYIDNIIYYKAFILAFILIDIYTFYCFIKILSKNDHLAKIMIITLPVLFQFRLYHDPILSYHILMELLLFYLFISLIFLIKFLQSKKIVYLCISILFYNLALYTYEISYLFFIIHFILILYISKNIKLTLQNVSPFFFSTLIAFIITIYFRTKANVISEAYTMNFNLVVYLKTVIKQIFSSMPLSYFIFNFSTVFNFTLKNFINNISTNDIIMWFLLIYLFYTLVKRLNEQIDYKILILIGISFIILPSLMISFSPKYQQEIVWGIGYLPVYIQYFGTVMFLIGIIIWLYYHIKNLKLKLFIKVILLLTLTLIALINIQNNRTIVEKFNLTMHYPRVILEEALKNGLTEDIPEDSTILIDSNNIWDNKYFFYMITNKRFNVINIKDYVEDIDKKDQAYYKNLSDKHIYIVKYTSNKINDGYVLLGKIKDIFYDSQSYNELQINIDQLKIFLLDKENKYKSIIGKTLWNNQKRYEITLLPINGHGLNSLQLDNRCIEFNSIGFSSISLTGYNNLNYANPDEKRLSKTLLKINQKSLIHCRFTDNRIVFNAINNKNIGINNCKIVNGISGQAAFFRGDVNDLITLHKINLSQRFTVEMILYPFEKNLNYACLIGNHPGFNDYEGFVIQQNGSLEPNTYVFSAGDGESWMQPINDSSFFLEPNKFHYLCVVFNNLNVKIYDNGKMVKDVKYKGKALKQSEMPLIIGNWINRDRPFNGIIEEVRISDDIMNSRYILQNYDDIKNKFKDVEINKSDILYE
jgi:hypothetical protein